MKGPVDLSSKRRQRIENKKKKMTALLEVIKLNEIDRDKSKVMDNLQGLDNGLSPHKKLKTEEKIAAQPVLTEDQERVDLRRKLKEKTKKIKQAPKFHLRDMGESASLKIPVDQRCPLFLSDIQFLLAYSQMGIHSPYSPARWCNLEKYNNLSNVTMLIVENMSLYHYESFENHFPFTSSNFENKVEIVSPFSFAKDFVKEFSVVPISATQMRKLISEHGNLENAAKNSGDIFDTVHHFFNIVENEDDAMEVGETALPLTDKFCRTKLLLSGWQMIDENFPLPIKGLMERKFPSYVNTKDKYKPVTSHSPLIAIDCEMCKTDKEDLELTRISVVNEKHEVLYDSLVKPENKIVDYLTRFSGINSKMMKKVTKRLKDVQAELKELLPDDAILVGQSLANDLHAMKMMHPYVIDTSVIYNMTGDRTRKTKLQTLAREFLKEKIQMGNHGHCSSEDSLACMKLVQLKLKHNPYFGDAVMNPIYVSSTDMGPSNYSFSMLRQCVKLNNNSVNLVGVDDLVDRYRFYLDKDPEARVDNIKCSKVESNKGVIKHLCDTMDKFRLNIGHVRIAQDRLSDSAEGSSSDKEKTFKVVDKWISKLHSAAPEPALVLVLFSGQKEGGNGACFLQLKREFIL